ncbi:hypothetical protein G6L37_06240 [Agrobacterium rubi]|nr:hypothetical protein [Agrobacterium rubi]NTF24961.1 hypothetical protein [Agrobacterium rubi]
MPRNTHEALKQIDDLLASAVKLNQEIPDAVLVGGTAVAVYAKHRLSTDTDYVLNDLKGKFDEVFGKMESSEDWELARSKAPVLIMGNFHGVETTLRQLIRAKPLETEYTLTPTGKVLVPTLDEMIRIKSWLVLTRNAYRDYLDLAALSEVAGVERTKDVLAGFDRFYADVDRKGVVRDVSPALQLALQLFEPKPHDLAKRDEMERYKGVQGQWADSAKVLERCNAIGFALGEQIFIDMPDIEHDLEKVDSARQQNSPQAVVPAYPKDTHEPHISSNGTVVVIRTRGENGSGGRVDNPDGPAVVSPTSTRYAIDGKFLSQEEWRRTRAPEREAEEIASPSM